MQVRATTSAHSPVPQYYVPQYYRETTIQRLLVNLSKNHPQQRIRARIANSFADGFVHANISCQLRRTAQDGVVGGTRTVAGDHQRVNGPRLRATPKARRLVKTIFHAEREKSTTPDRRTCHCVSLSLGARLPGLRDRNELGRLQDPYSDRNRRRDPIRNHHASARNRGEPHLHVAQVSQILDRGAGRDMSGNRREGDGADHRGSLIAPLRFHFAPIV